MSSGARILQLQRELSRLRRNAGHERCSVNGSFNSIKGAWRSRAGGERRRGAAPWARHVHCVANPGATQVALALALAEGSSPMLHEQSSIYTRRQAWRFTRGSSEMKVTTLDGQITLHAVNAGDDARAAKNGELELRPSRTFGPRHSLSPSSPVH